MRSVACGAWRLVLLGVLGLVGCKTPAPNPTDLLPTANPLAAGEAMPTYGELVARYNARLVGVESVWARTQVEAVWRDDRGQMRSESGKGRLIVRRPLDTAVTVEALGKTVMWAGSNDREYWLFSDLHRGGELVFGRFGRRGMAGLPMPVSPSMIPILLGLTPLPESPDWPGYFEPVESLRGYALVEPPGLSIRMLLDPVTGTPVRVDLLDSLGRSAVVCVLSGELLADRPEEPEMFMEGGTLVVPGVGSSAGAVMLPPEALDEPLVLPSSVTMYPVGDESRMELELRSVDLADRRVRSQLFDLAALRASLKPDRVVDLDAALAE